MQSVDKWPEIARHIAGSRMTVVAQRDATVLVIGVNDATLEIIVPHNVPEWFVTVRDSGGVPVLSDWMDHYYRPQAQLDLEMRGEICSFVESVLGTGTRLRMTPRGQILETERDGEWTQILPFVAEAR